MTLEEYKMMALSLRDRTLRALEGLGWSRREGGRVVYQHVREEDLRHEDRMEAYTLEREYSFESYDHTVEGKAILDSAEVERIAWSHCRTAQRGGDASWVAASVNLYIVFHVPDGELRHPHANADGSCMTVPRMQLPGDLDLAALMLAGAITKLVEVVDINNALNNEWGVCRACGAEGVINSEHCGECDMRYCEDCFTDPGSHECRAEHDEESEMPDEEIEPGAAEREALPAWRDRVQDRAPRLPQPVGECFLVGCGVTGSWVAPVLMRAAQRLTVIDPDMLDGDSPHGLWTAGQGPKVQAIPFGRYSVRGLTLRYRGQGTDADLFVLCPDNAQSRLAIDDNEREVRQVLDIRATPSGLTVWAVTDEEDDARDGAWRAWRRSLEGYVEPEACHHDNVPIKAGTLAAAFVAWWITSGRPDGLWNIPYGYQGLPFAGGQQGGG